MVLHGSRGACFIALDHGADARRLNATVPTNLDLELSAALTARKATAPL